MDDEEEVLRSIVRRSKELRRKRRLEQAALASVAEEPETSAAGERRAAEGNFPRKKSADKPSLGDELDTSGPSKEHQNDLITEKQKIPDLKRRKHGRLSNSLQKKAERLKYLESRKAVKVGKQRDIKKVLPLHSILKKYTKHTSVKMVKEKHGNSKGTGVIQLCRKSVKRVKFSETDDAKKQCSKRPPLESIRELLSAISSSSSSSIEMSSEEEHVIAESSSSHMTEKAVTMASEANENTNHDNQYELSSTRLSTGLLDLNQALPEPTDLNNPYVPNSEVSNLEQAQVGTWNLDQQVLGNGRKNIDSSFDLHGQEQLRHSTELDTTSKGKSPCTLSNGFQDSVHLQQNWSSMTLHHGVSQLSTGGEPSSFEVRESNISHSEKRNFSSETNVEQELRPSAGQTLRLMGHDLTVSDTRVDYLSDAAQNHTNNTADHLTTKVVLELPRQGQPFLALQTQSIPSVSASSARTAQAHFGYRTTHNISHPLLAANVFSGDPSVYEDRCRDFTNLQSHRNSILGYPPLSNHGSAAFLQNSPPWRYYSDHSTRRDSLSAPFTPTVMQHVATPSDYRANLPHQSYGVYSGSSTVRPLNSASFTCTNQIVQAVDSRATANLPSRSPTTGTTRTHHNSNTSSSSRLVLRSGPVKLSAGAKHILIPNENTEDDNSAPMYSCVSFGSSGGNVSAAYQNKGAGSHRHQNKGAGSRRF